jgi:2-oxoisovalerate ferredoxin oxidoreductase beta subunit
MCELLATLEAPVYIERVALGNNKMIMQAARAVKRRSKSRRVASVFPFWKYSPPVRLSGRKNRSTHSGGCARR